MLVIYLLHNTLGKLFFYKCSGTFWVYIAGLLHSIILINKYIKRPYLCEFHPANRVQNQATSTYMHRIATSELGVTYFLVTLIYKLRPERMPRRHRLMMHKTQWTYVIW